MGHLVCDSHQVCKCGCALSTAKKCCGASYRLSAYLVWRIPPPSPSGERRIGLVSVWQMKCQPDYCTVIGVDSVGEPPAV